MDLNRGQEVAFKAIKEFIDSSQTLCTLSGPAGTGKTTLTKLIINTIRKSGKQVLCAAPTHKARKVLNNIVNTGTFLKIHTTTVSSLLGKLKAHSYVGTQHFKKLAPHKLGMYDVIIIDEISMVTSVDYYDLVKLASALDKKLIFIGDSLQIPHPQQKYVPDGQGFYVKETNPAFREPMQLVLDQIMRTDSNSLICLMNKIRSNIGQGFNFRDFGIEPDSSVMLYDSASDFIQSIKDDFHPQAMKIIAYTNRAVDMYNHIVRKKAGYSGDIVEGEILMGYMNVGPPNDLTIENGQDYLVKGVRECRKDISANGITYSGLVGKDVILQEVNMDTEVVVFFPDLHDESNCTMLEDLAMLASRVNSIGSKKIDYVKYTALKSQLIFMENIYQYKNNIYTCREFRELHPLLFTNTTEIISDKRETFIQNYPDLIGRREKDDKDFCQSETFADMFQILQRDISYGYAITAHKSQGSTYQTVFIDEPDFNIIRNKGNRLNVVERDRLKYVAVSRASDSIRLLLTG